MKEIPLKFYRNEDPTIVPADEEKLKALTKSYNELASGVSYMLSLYKEGKLTEGFKETLLQLTESYTGEICEKFGYEGVIKKQKEERYAEIRKLNDNNRELRKQLGEKVSNEDFRERIKLLFEAFKRWWNIEGFGHLSEERFSGGGYLQAKLSGMVTEPYYNRKVGTEKEKVKKLTAYGFEINEDNGNHVIDSDANRTLLTKLLKAKYPSIEITDYSSHIWGGKSTLREIHIIIYDLDDIKIEPKTTE